MTRGGLAASPDGAAIRLSHDNKTWFFWYGQDLGSRPKRGPWCDREPVDTED